MTIVSNVGGIMNALGEMRGLGHPKQPILNRKSVSATSAPALNEEWFIKTITDKDATHPDNSMEYPFNGEKIYDEPLMGFISVSDHKKPLDKNVKRV